MMLSKSEIVFVEEVSKPEPGEETAVAKIGDAGTETSSATDGVVSSVRVTDS